MAVPVWGMYGRKPMAGKFDPDPYDQTEENRQGPGLTVDVTARRPNYDKDPYDQVGRENIPTLPMWIDREGNDVSPATTNGNSNSNSNGIMGFIQSLLGGGGGLGGLGNLGSLLASYYSSQRAADEMEEQAGRYGALGREAADRASPISNARRGEWDARLTRLYEDPQGFLESNPEYMNALSVGNKAVDRENALQRKYTSGEGTSDRMRFASELGAKYIGKERDDLMSMAGYQFDPGNSARMLMEGGRLEGDALQAALAARLYPLGELSRMMTQGNGGGGPGGGSGGGNPIQQLLNMFKNPNGSPVNAASILQMLSRNGGSLAGLFGNSPIGPGIAETTGMNVWEGTPWSRTVLDAQDPGYGSWWEGNDMNYTNWDWSNPALSGYNPEGIYGEDAAAISDFFSPDWWTSIFGG